MTNTVLGTQMIRSSVWPLPWSLGHLFVWILGTLWRALTGTRFGDYRRESAVQNALISCWCDHRICTDKASSNQNMTRDHTCGPEWSTIFDWSTAPVISNNLSNSSSKPWKIWRGITEPMLLFFYCKSWFSPVTVSGWNERGQKMGPRYAIPSVLSSQFGHETTSDEDNICWMHTVTKIVFGVRRDAICERRDTNNRQRRFGWLLLTRT